MVVAYWRVLADRGVTSVPNFSDPKARELLDGRLWRTLLGRADTAVSGPDRKAVDAMRPWVDGIVLRVAFIDAVAAEAGVRQFVILGAGLDTRAWRLEAMRGARIFEVDHPSTQAYKRERAARLGMPVGELSFVPVDFTRDDLGRALAAAGHDPNQPTVWIWEGVTMYLDDAALRGTLGVMRRLSCPGSRAIVHYHEPEQGRRTSLSRRIIFRLLGEPQIGLRMRATMADEMARAGFRVLEDAGLPEQAARVGAPPPTNARLTVSRLLVAEPA